jgi:hypothetical protein
MLKDLLIQPDLPAQHTQDQRRRKIAVRRGES